MTDFISTFSDGSTIHVYEALVTFDNQVTKFVVGTVQVIFNTTSGPTRLQKLVNNELTIRSYMYHDTLHLPVEMKELT